MPPMNLHWRFLGRPIKPVAFSLAFSMLVIAWAAITDVGVLDGSWLADILGGAAILTAGVLAFGWWRSSQRIATIGLLMSSVIWALRFWLIIFVADNVISQEGLWLSIGWMGVASGSYLLEKTDGRPPRARKP